jgi:hypothetical protein
MSQVDILCKLKQLLYKLTLQDHLERCGQIDVIDVVGHAVEKVDVDWNALSPHQIANLSEKHAHQIAQGQKNSMKISIPK